jgi:hypothetical protein
MVPRVLPFLAVTVIPALAWQSPTNPPVSLRETVAPSAFRNLGAGPVEIAGRVTKPACSNVLVRVITSLGASTTTRTPVQGTRFRCRYPADFRDAPVLSPGALFIDATADDAFDPSRNGAFQAEATVIVHDSMSGQTPELPSAFTCDLLDHAGRTDQASTEWPTVRALVNLYMRSRAAELVHVGHPDFDLAKPADLAWFKQNLTLYDFDHRDRDWNQPLGHRVARTFWQSVWNAWFNSSNDHPLDGNPANNRPGNYLPYAFANDFADILLTYAMRQRSARPLDDNLDALCREGTENLLALQHRGTTNFALPDAEGKREHYTAGAFRYGLFENGEFMTEGKGWFYNPRFRDYADGGVLNGRAVWALGEVLRHEPQGPLSGRLKEAIGLALRFCLHDGLASKYTKRTPAGNRYWRDAGEHAYLLLGMLAACEVAPDLPVHLGADAPATALDKLCTPSLNGLVDLVRTGAQWSIYPNVDSMAIAALARGAIVLKDQPDAARWRETAMRVADAWLAAPVDPRERTAPCAHFGLRRQPDRMTLVWGAGRKAQIFYYQSGHWVQALAELYALTRDARYRVRAEAIVSYLCGDNPWHVRLFNELGGVYNWSDDTDGDGIEDWLKQDMYPESTAFCQIGILRLSEALRE